MSSLDDFARALLARLGAPPTSTDLAFLSGWFAREGTSAAFNPLATTLPAAGAGNFNSVGVKNYPDFATGVDATARTLLGGYPHIVADLRAGDGIAAGSEHAELRKWSGGGYDTVGPGTGGGNVGQGGGGGGGGGGMSITDAIGTWLMDAIGFIGLGLGGAQAAATGKLDELRQDSLRESQRVVLTPGELAAAVVKGHVSVEYARDQGTYSGLNPDRMDVLIDTTGNPPGPQELLRMVNRGILTIPDVERGLREGYLRPEWIPQVMQLRNEILGPHEAVEAAVQGHLSYDVAKEAAGLNGVPPQMFDILYRTAGNPPGPTELLTLWQRGEISEGRVDEGLRESRLKDSWIGDFKRLALRRIPLRTITTLLNNGAISDDTARAKLQQLGYSADDANALIAGHKAPPKAPHHALTVTQVRDLYADHLITRDQAAADLVAVGYEPGAADQLLTYTDVVNNRRFRVAAVTKVRSSYVARKIDKATASSELDRLQTPADQRDAMLTLWDIERDSTPHTLSPTDVCAAGRLQLIPPAEVLQRLSEMGFSDNDAVLFAMIHKGIALPPQGG